MSIRIDSDINSHAYKPRGNSQLLLRKSVQAYVLKHQHAVAAIVDALEEVKLPSEKTCLAALVDAPKREAVVQSPSKVRGSRMPRKFDFAARNEANRKLGRAGEQWVIEFEQQRLTDLGGAELFQQLDWVSDTQGDGAGFDILSFEDERRHRFIEVKTTNGGVGSSFLVSHNELEFSREVGEQFYLYRVFQFRQGPRLLTLGGDLTQHVHLKPTDFRASFRGIVG